MDQLETAILKTVKYGRKYGAEYGHGEIKERLIAEKIYSDREIEKELKVIKQPDVRNKYNRLWKKKVTLAENLGERLGKNFPDILMVGVTGSVAAGYPKDDEDIDLMIITKNDRLWFARLSVKFWTNINKIPQRSYGADEKKNDFCLNLWLEEGSLELPDNRQNLKNAMDLILMKPIVNKDNIYERFILENRWAEKYVATGYDRINPVRSRNAGPPSFDKESRILSIFMRVINRVAFWVQYWYMKRKLTTETVDLERAFFHPKKRSGRML